MCLRPFRKIIYTRRKTRSQCLTLTKNHCVTYYNRAGQTDWTGMNIHTIYYDYITDCHIYAQQSLCTLASLLFYIAANYFVYVSHIVFW